MIEKIAFNLVKLWFISQCHCPPQPKCDQRWDEPGELEPYFQVYCESCEKPYQFVD